MPLLRAPEGARAAWSMRPAALVRHCGPWGRVFQWEEQRTHRQRGHFIHQITSVFSSNRIQQDKMAAPDIILIKFAAKPVSCSLAPTRHAAPMARNVYCTCDVVAAERGQAEASGHDRTQTLTRWFVPGVPEPKRPCALSLTKGRGRYSARRALRLWGVCSPQHVFFLPRYLQRARRET